LSSFDAIRRSKNLTLSYLKIKLKTTTGASKPSRLRETRFYDDDYDEYNCEDFETWEQAQKVFESSGGVENDVRRLDRDHDGISCEALR